MHTNITLFHISISISITTIIMTDSVTHDLCYLIATVVGYDALHVPMNPETDPHTLVAIYSTYVYPVGPIIGSTVFTITLDECTILFKLLLW